MKIDARGVEAFLAAPGTHRAVLLHGEDAGLIRERGARLVLAVAGSLDDPFRVVELDREAHHRIPEEFTSRSLTGGRRVVRIRDANDAVLAFVQRALAGPGEALMVLEAPGLAARGKLRSAIEKTPDAAAIACYTLDPRALEQTIVAVLGEIGVSIDTEARQWLVGQLGADQAVTRRELEKLATFAGRGGRVDLAAAQQCVGDLAGLSVEDALFAATSGDVEAADRALELAMAEGMAPVGILRAALYHMQRLQRARSGMAQGESALEATKAVRPPVFYQREAQFARTLGFWTEDALQAACVRIWEAERECKRTGTPAETLGRSVVLGVAQRAAVARRR